MGHVDPQSFSAQSTVLPGSDDQIPPALRASTEYEVIREINRGGMGVVYLVRNRRMDRLECLKVIQEAILNRAGILERFEREMRSAARLSHTNIVTAYSSPPLPGLLAFAMEYVDGTDLASLVKAHGPLPVSNACCYIHQVAQGLQHAHEERLVHRDIKPNNLILKCTGDRHVVKILDFGLAKATSENRTDGGLTGTGEMMGTPHYMAPEQIANAAKADIRADIYSLGCTLYHLLSGRPPFKQHGDLYGILHAHNTETAQLLNQLRPEIPPDLAAIVATMLAKNPAERFQKPADVAQALAPFFSDGIRPITAGDVKFQQATGVDSKSGESVEKDVGKPCAATTANPQTPSPSTVIQKAENQIAVKKVDAIPQGNHPIPAKRANRQRPGMPKARVPTKNQWVLKTGLAVVTMLIATLLFAWKNGVLDKPEKSDPGSLAGNSTETKSATVPGRQESTSGVADTDKTTETGDKRQSDTTVAVDGTIRSDAVTEADSLPSNAASASAEDKGRSGEHDGDKPKTTLNGAEVGRNPGQAVALNGIPRVIADRIITGKFKRTDFEGFTFKRCDFVDCDFDRAYFTGVKMIDCRFGANVDFSSGNARFVVLIRCTGSARWGSIKCIDPNK